MPALAYGLLPKAIAITSDRYKQIKISVEMGNRREVEEGLESAQYNLGIATLPINQQSIDVEPLFSVDGDCVMPKGHQLSEKTIVKAEDLEGVSYVSVNPGSLFRYKTDELFGRLGVKRKINIEAPSALLATNLVAKGLGVSIVHPFIAEEYGDKVESRPFSPSIKVDYGMLYPAGQTRSRITNIFTEELRKIYADKNSIY
jgi:DNA-binding transcriptional LysR family regulator